MTLHYKWLALLFIYLPVHGQQLQWAHTLYPNGGVQFPELSSVFAMADSTYYIGGQVSDTMDLDPGANTVLLGSNSQFGIGFIAHYDTNGGYLNHIAFPASQNSQVADVQYTANGALLFCGNYKGVLTYDSNGQSKTLPAYFKPNGIDMFYGSFAGAFDANGTLKWVKSFQTDYPLWTNSGYTKMQILQSNSSSGRIMITGTVRDSLVVAINGVNTTYPCINNNGATYLLELDSTGSFTQAYVFDAYTPYAHSVGNIGMRLMGLLLTDSCVYISGTLHGAVDWDPTPSGTYIDSSVGKGYAWFAAKFNMNGPPAWVHIHSSSNREDSSGYTTAFYIDADTLGNVTVFGQTQHDSSDFAIPPSTAVLKRIHNCDLFAARYKQNGDIAFMKKLGSTNSYTGLSTYVEKRANGYNLLTSLGESCDVDPTSGTLLLQTVPVVTQNGLALLKYSDTLRLQQAMTWPSAQQVSPWGAKTLPSGAVIATAILRRGIAPPYVFDANASVQGVSSQLVPFKMSIAVMKLAPCAAEPTTQTISACGPYALPSGQLVYASGIYPYSALDTSLCLRHTDYTVAITNVDTAVVQNGGFLTAQAAAPSTYQWINCTTKQPVPGANAATFMAPANGGYAVVVQLNGCSDTSACYSITNTAMPALEKQNIHAQIVNGILTVQAPQQAYIQVYNVAGQLLHSARSSSGHMQLDIASAGLYVVRYSRGEDSGSIKVCW